jgi:ADP-ribosylglycohydrolase
MNSNINYAKKSLLGLSIGDAFGDSFFGESEFIAEQIHKREIPPATKWEFTDDTVMAIAVVNNLEKFGEINQEELAKQFAANYQRDINRGYGGTAHKVLREIGEGGNWKEISANVFDGQGSMGNGGAMRVGPLGAFFYDDEKKLIEQAEKSAEVTHFNHEAKVGAVAIALAANLALNLKLKNEIISAEEFIQKIYSALSDSDTKSKIGKSLHVSLSSRMETVTTILGNGTKLLAQDTVPFAIWCAAHHLYDFEKALWKAVAALGDKDTICAMVGSIVILSADEKTIPEEWVSSVEKVERSEFL